MDTSLLPQLREIEVFDAKSAIMRARVALAIFGHSHLSKQELQDYDIDINEAAEDYGWDVKEGTLLWSINLEGFGKATSAVQFGKPPSKRELKEIQAARAARAKAAAGSKAR